jgi:hypothetical protein
MKNQKNLIGFTKDMDILAIAHYLNSHGEEISEKAIDGDALCRQLLVRCNAANSLMRLSMDSDSEDTSIAWLAKQYAEMNGHPWPPPPYEG